MIIWSIISVLVIILLIIGWRLSWLATRVDRANARTESTWARAEPTRDPRKPTVDPRKPVWHPRVVAADPADR